MSREYDSVRKAYTHYGPRTANESQGGESSNGGKTKQATYKFAWNDLPAGSATDETVHIIPAGAQITSAYVKATTTFVTGTDYDIGLAKAADATAYNADGLFDALTLVEINAGAMASDNVFFLQGLELTEDCQVTVADNLSDFTAGEATLVVEYVV